MIKKCYSRGWTLIMQRLPRQRPSSRNVPIWMPSSAYIRRWILTVLTIWKKTVSRDSIPLPAAYSLPCTGAACGRCGHTPDLLRRKKPMPGINTCCRQDRPAFPLLWTCPPRSGWIPTRNYPTVKSARWAWQLIRWLIWSSCLTVFRWTRFPLP